MFTYTFQTIILTKKDIINLNHAIANYFAEPEYRFKIHFIRNNEAFNKIVNLDIITIEEMQKKILDYHRKDDKRVYLGIYSGN